MRMNFGESYLKKMKIILSFFFRDEDVKSIIYDYEEQLDIREDDKNQCRFMETPVKECIKIINEAEMSPVKILLTNSKTRMILLLFVFVFVATYAVTKCERNNINFLIPAICLNFIFFVTQNAITRNENITKQKCSVINILILICVCTECLIIGIYMPNVITDDIGYVFVGVIMAIAAIGILLNAIIISMNYEVCGYLLVMHHVVTVFLITLYFVSQIHIMQDNALSFSLQIMKGAIFIYCESIVLQFFRIGVNKFRI